MKLVKAVEGRFWYAGMPAETTESVGLSLHTSLSEINRSPIFKYLISKCIIERDNRFHSAYGLTIMIPPEPQSVYQHLTMLDKNLSNIDEFTIVILDTGNNILYNGPLSNTKDSLPTHIYYAPAVQRVNYITAASIISLIVGNPTISDRTVGQFILESDCASIDLLIFRTSFTLNTFRSNVLVALLMEMDVVCSTDYSEPNYNAEIKPVDQLIVPTSVSIKPTKIRSIIHRYYGQSCAVLIQDSDHNVIYCDRIGSMGDSNLCDLLDYTFDTIQQDCYGIILTLTKKEGTENED